MAEAPKKTTIRKIRTFADDAKRAGGMTASVQSTVLPAASGAAAPAQTQVLKTAVSTAAQESAVDGAAFDLREETEAAVADATIIKDHRAKRWSLTDEISRGMGSWAEDLTSGMTDWREGLKRILEPKKAAPSMVPDIAPVMRAEPQIQNTATEPVPAPSQQPAKTEWRRISEPRDTVPLPHATKEEAHAFREKLIANLPKPERAPEPQRAFKAARPKRPVVDPQIARQRLEALQASFAPQERPAPIAKPIAPTPNVPPPQVQPEEAPAPKEPTRSIPFIPPTYHKPQAAAPLRTFRNDAIEDVQTRHLSAPEIAAAELDRRAIHRAPIIVARPPSRAMPILFLLSIVLAFGIGGTVLYQRFGGSESTPIVTSSAGFFETDITEQMPLAADRASFLATLSSARENLTLDAGAFAQWVIDAPLTDVVSVFDPRAPGAFIRSLKSSLMFGAYGEREEPYLVLETTSFEAGFAGMLAWEDSMSADLAPFFGEPVRKSYEPGSLTVDQTRPAYFRDYVAQNRDVRLLVDETGTSRIMYAFIDETTIIIAPNAEVLDAVARKLR